MKTNISTATLLIFLRATPHYQILYRNKKLKIFRCSQLKFPESTIFEIKNKYFL
jgi:hypothetical protein